MAIRPESRWWIVTLVLVGLLFGLSALALDRPDVVWRKDRPHCPHCRTEVLFGAHRCPQCREEFDWAVAPEEVAPRSPWTLSALEEDALRQRVRELKEPQAVERVAQALRITTPAARDYVESVGAGKCGWCGGTGRELETTDATPGARSGPEVPCQVCQGNKRCITCSREQRMRLGDPGAELALVRYRAALADLRPSVPLELQRGELQRALEEFLDRHAGSVEAASLLQPASWMGADRAEHARTLVSLARGRLQRVLDVLSAP